MAKSTSPTAPFRRSWVDGMFEGIENLPGPWWWLHAVLAVGTIPLSLWWNSAAKTPPTVNPVLAGMIGPLIFTTTHWLRRSTRQAVAILRPALPLDDAAVAALSHRMVETPAKWGYISVFFSIAYVVSAVAQKTDPYRYSETFEGPALVAGVIGWIFFEIVGWILLVATVRRLYFVSNVNRDTVEVNLFRSQPLHAFGMLTARTGLSILIVFLYVPFLSGRVWHDPFYVITTVAGAILALVITVVPLRSIHARLVAERTRFLYDIGVRTERAMEALSQSLDRKDAAGVESGQKGLAALVAQRDIVTRVKTWPWEPGTARTLATTVILPVVLLIAGRGFDRWFG